MTFEQLFAVAKEQSCRYYYIECTLLYKTFDTFNNDHFKLLKLYIQD